MASPTDILRAVLPSGMPTVRDAITDIDRAGERLTVAAVRQRLRELRGFDASPKETAEAIKEYREIVGACADTLFALGADAAQPADGRLLREAMAKRWHEHSRQAVERKANDGDDAGTG
jgi:hypothetical protein